MCRAFRTLCKTFPLFYLGIEEACFSGWDWKSLENKESCRSEVRVVKASMFEEFRNSSNSNLQHFSALLLVCLFVGHSASIAVCIFDFRFNLKQCGLFGDVLFGEMMFVLSNFLSNEDLSTYFIWDVQLTFDTLINAFKFKA